MEPIHFEALYPSNTREHEIKKVMEIVKKGGSCQVIGLPGAGKSNVMRLIPFNRNVREHHLGKDEPLFHFIYMDVSEIRGRNLYDVIKFIIISISYSLGERRLTAEQTVINDFLKEALDFKDELILFQALKKSLDFLTMEKGLNVVFFFDRFENYIPDIDARFFLNLNVLRSRLRHNFAVVFAVGRPIEDTVEPNLYEDFYEFAGNNIFLPLKDATGLAFRFPYLEKITGKQASEEVKNEIEALTAGHGKLTRVCFEAVLAEDLKDTDKLEEFLLADIQVKGALLEIWNYLTPEEKKDLKTGAKNDFLEKVNLLADGKIAIPLFATFIKAQPQEEANTELKYDSETNEIKKGEENISEKLTPLEFKLLRFIMTHEGKICEKDEIIQAVWLDTKTQDGVTDQALDQIIYRLRKKIENDPNNPHFIHTIKGRGYKFTK